MTVGIFMESYDLTGKTIYPISQSASMNTSQYAQSVVFVKECAKGATVDDGLFTKNNETIREYYRKYCIEVSDRNGDKGGSQHEYNHAI